MNPRNILRPLFITAILLLIPLVGSLFSHEMQWTLFDYVFAGILTFVVALVHEWGAKRGGSKAYRFGLVVALAAAFLLVWVNGAVGIIGDDNPANLLYGAVLVALVLGAGIARMRPGGLSRALFVTALVQALVPVIAFVFWPPWVIAWTPSVLGIFALNAIFVVLWVASGLLFRTAGGKVNA